MLLIGQAASPAAVSAAGPPRVAIIVGPVGDLTETYIEIAEISATRAEALGAVVARAYSPAATPENVLAAVEDANIVLYLGHGIGVPNPYSQDPDPETVNGWGLQGPDARGDHSDSWQDGTLAYYGEAWLAANARPAPGFVMIYSNACYAPGAGEGMHPPATLDEAASRVSGYSRAPLMEMGASGYFATDFYGGAAELIGAMLADPSLSVGQVFTMEPRFEEDGVTRLPHASLPGHEVWLQRSAYFDGKVDHWYAFAGDPEARPGTISAATLPLAQTRDLPVIEYRDPHSY